MEKNFLNEFSELLEKYEMTIIKDEDLIYFQNLDHTEYYEIFNQTGYEAKNSNEINY